MKKLTINDEVHSKLKEEANKSGMTMVSYISYLIDMKNIKDELMYYIDGRLSNVTSNNKEPKKKKAFKNFDTFFEDFKDHLDSGLTFSERLKSVYFKDELQEFVYEFHYDDEHCLIAKRDGRIISKENDAENTIKILFDIKENGLKYYDFKVER